MQGGIPQNGCDTHVLQKNADVAPAAFGGDDDAISRLRL